DVMDALQRLTHDPHIPYMEYIQQIKQNPIATKVKLADLKHNSDLSRLDEITEKDLKRLQKYQAAIELLTK
ncbi:MAG: GTP pyrophosphokinase, partial [Traorella sp.]